MNVLVTHGIVNPCFPHGALVVQGMTGCTSDEGNQAETPSTEKPLALLLRHSIFHKTPTRKKKRRNSGCADERKRADLSERLPLELIVERLPLRQHVQMLCVCKAWNHMLRDSVTAELEEIQKGPWLFMGGYFRGTGWELMAYRITGSLLTQVCLMPSGHEALGGINGSYKLSLMGCQCDEWLSDFFLPRMASSGGLMCCLLSADAHHVNGVVAVFNCVTSSLKMLPPPLCSGLLFPRRDLYKYGTDVPCPCHIYMAVDDLNPKRYYIMLTRVREYCCHYFSSTDRHMEVFDSKIGGWEDASIPIDRWECDTIDEFFPSHVWDGNFFFIYEDTSQDTTMYLAAYHVESDVWSMQLVPIYRNMHACYGAFTIHKFEGRLFFASEPTDRFGFRIWEVRQTASRAAEWVEIACTPPQISRDIEINTSNVLLAGGSCFFLITHKNGFSTHGSPPLVFDMANNSWYFLPVKEWLSGYRGVLVHQPSLSARI